MNDYSGVGFDGIWQAPIEKVNTGVHSPIIGHSSSYEGQPDKKVPGQLLRPEERIVEYISAENLNYNDYCHAKTENKQTLLCNKITAPA